MAITNFEGQTLGGRYQIKTLVGQGGMSSVYKAYDPNLRRTVAIKIIHPHLSNNPEFVYRFEEEAAAVARLRHPNIVQVYDFNHEGDLYYMVLEFILGETLQERLKRLNAAGRSLSVEDAIRFTINISDAIEYAHERGMIHRDIKPANVMLDVNGNAILMDFGVARILGSQQHTATGTMLGTAMYMSPEQIQGLHADTRADIYALGVTLFEMLSGHPPYEADSAMTLMMMHVNDPVPNIQAIQPQVPEAMVAVLNQAMAKNRSDRFQNAGQMANSLKGILETLEPTLTEAAPNQNKPKSEAPATIIETIEKPDPNSTIIEAAPVAISASARTPTSTQPPISASPPESFPSTPAQTSLPVKPKANKLWKLIFIGLSFAIISIASYFGYQYFFSDGNSSNGKTIAAIPPTPETSSAPLVAIPLTPTNTLPSTTDQPTAAPTITATNTIKPSATPTDTPAPTPTNTSEPDSIVIGGADKLAFISGKEIWVANLDGSDLTQLTQDGTLKKYLRWLPDGQFLSYLSGKCIQIISLDGDQQTITCFNRAEYLDAFEISPDGKQVAISLDRQIYLVPFDLSSLSEADTHTKLANLATCTDLSPYQRNFGTAVNWSRDGTQWAATVLGVLSDGRRGDLIQVFPVDRCIPNPKITIQFPEPFFSYPEYDRSPTLESISWDGISLFSFHGNTRNDGFGDLHIFNIAIYSPDIAINPIGGACCYRDPQWSPDGTYLLFAFQNSRGGPNSTTQLYYIPFGSIGSGASFDPIPLPDIIDPREKPSPVLRQALTP